MKKIYFSRFLFFAFALVILGACSKYEEGSPSLLSKKSRLVNDWKVVSITANGIDITATNIITEVIIRDNNTITVTNELLGFPVSDDGTWVFNANKTHVLVTNNNGSLTSYEIVKLEKDSFKVRNTDSNGTTFLHEYETK